MSYTSPYEKYKVGDIIPEGTSGRWTITRRVVTKADVAAQSISFSNRGRVVPEGTYTELNCGGTIVMSDTPDEMRDHWSIISEAKGRVLIAGLGIGMVTRAILDKVDRDGKFVVDHVTVIEKSPDVIALVAPHYLARYGERLTVIEADIMEWKPAKGDHWNAAWYDIWNTLCGDNLESMKTLHRRFGKKTDWQGSWGREICERAEREWKSSYWGRKSR